MTKKRILTAAAALALTVGLGSGIAAAQTDPTTPTNPPAAGSMHSGDMDAMHAQMPEDMQAQCDTMRTQGGMTDGTTNGSMNGGMGGSGMGGAMSSQS